MKQFNLGFNSAMTLGLLTVPVANATDNPFAMQELSSAFQMTGNDDTTLPPVVSEGKCGEGKCGTSLGKMPEGSCGNMILDTEGIVMNANSDQLPKDCKKISEDVAVTVRAGTKYSANFHGTVFGFDQHQWQIKPCSRITVTLINEDEVRHQWMVHNLPSYLYPQGMFHLEVNGGYQKTGTFIVPSGNQTYLVHCDLAQHMEKGMKGQLIVGTGSGDLPSIPGISGARFPDNY